MQTRTGARSNLKSLLQEINITAMLEEKLETKELEMHQRKLTKLNYARLGRNTWKHGKTSDSRNRQSVDYGGDSEDLTESEKTTGD